MRALRQALHKALSGPADTAREDLSQGHPEGLLLQLPSAHMASLEQGLPVVCVVRVAQDTIQIGFVEWHGLILVYEPYFTHLELSILAGSAVPKQTIAVSSP